MRERLWPYLLFMAFLAVLFYTAFQATLFYRLSSDWIEREDAIATAAGGVGILQRNVALRSTMPNPDFNYNACAFDLRRGAYFVQGPTSNEYWSLTIFNRRGEAMFSTAAGQPTQAFVLYPEDSPTPSDTRPFKAVSVGEPQGIIVFRLLADRTGREPLPAVQDELRCLPYRFV